MRLLVLLLLPLTIWAQDQRLESIRTLLGPMREAGYGLEARGATPALTQAKHLLRDWIEARLATLTWDGTRWIPNPTVLQEQINDELGRAGLFCGARSKIPCPDQSSLGFLEPITLESNRGVLVVRTSVGIQVCGVDESAYAYHYEDSRKQWQRFWQSEQNDYREGRYAPQRIEVVSVSHDYRNPDTHLILSLGTEPWCSSVWHPVYYRVWQAKAGLPQPLLLLDGNEMADVDEPINGTANSSDVLFEYSVIGPDADRDPEIRHYMLEQGKLVRHDPIATSPRSFVAAWLRSAWQESSLWTDPANRSKLDQWRDQNKAELAVADAETRHCRQRPDAWQVAAFNGIPRVSKVYFLLRWQPPYHFTMVSAGSQPNAGCDEEDPGADNPLPLFPDQ